jgi:hypothetical protein
MYVLFSMKCEKCERDTPRSEIAKEFGIEMIDDGFLYDCCTKRLYRYFLPRSELVDIAKRQWGLEPPECYSKLVEQYHLFWHKPVVVEQWDSPRVLGYRVDQGRLIPLRTQGTKRKRKQEYTGSDAISLFPDIDNPTTSCVLSKDHTHSAPQLHIQHNTVTNEKGYRMCKASHGVWQGRWYFETEMLNGIGACRIGWSQISGELQAPCGYDEYSYSLRNTGGLFHASRNVGFYATYGPGDRLGIGITLPESTKLDPRLVQRLWDPDRMDDYQSFKAPPLEKVPGSSIEYFLNGASLGIAFTDLGLGKYHPAISVYQGCSVQMVFDTKYCPPGYTSYHKVVELETWQSILEKEFKKQQEEEEKEEKGDGKGEQEEGAPVEVKQEWKTA